MTSCRQRKNGSSQFTVISVSKWRRVHTRFDWLLLSWRDGKWRNMLKMIMSPLFIVDYALWVLSFYFISIFPYLYFTLLQCNHFCVASVTPCHCEGTSLWHRVSVLPCQDVTRWLYLHAVNSLCHYVTVPQYFDCTTVHRCYDAPVTTCYHVTLSPFTWHRLPL